MVSFDSIKRLQKVKNDRDDVSFMREGVFKFLLFNRSTVTFLNFFDVLFCWNTFQLSSSLDHFLFGIICIKATQK